MFSFIIKNISIIDGSGRPSYVADLGIKQEKIAAIGDLASSSSSELLIDGTGLAVAPGFIDVHNHSDGWLLKKPDFTEKVSQGFTTEVLMSDGISYAPLRKEDAPDWFYYLRSLNGLLDSDYSGWESLGDYCSLLHHNTAQNFVAQIPYGNVRSIVKKWQASPAVGAEIAALKAIIVDEMENGSVGLSTGLEYVNQSFLTKEELVAVCSALKPYGGLYVTHIRYPLGLVEGLKEAVAIAGANGIPLHVSHLKGADSESADKLLEYINQRVVHEVDFSFDVYPYDSPSTMLHYILPPRVWERGPKNVSTQIDQSVKRELAEFIKTQNLDSYKIAWLPEGTHKSFQGKSLSQYAESTGQPAASAILNLLLATDFSVLIVIKRDNDSLVHPFLQHPCFMLGTDGVYFPEAPVHPRFYGSVGRLLGDCVRTHNLFPLEEAVSKLSYRAARRFGLLRRGELREGYFADLCIFDPATIREAEGRTLGIEKVFVNGTLVFSGGESRQFPRGCWPGRYLEYNQAAD